MQNYLFGKKALFDNLDNPSIIKVDLIRPTPDVLEKIKQSKITFTIHNNGKFFNQFPVNLNHQGIVITVQKKERYENILEYLGATVKETQLILVVDSLEDPFNFGAIIRTCDALGVDALIYKKDNQVQINEHVIKTSVGATNTVNLIKVANLSSTIDSLKQNGFWIYTSNLDERSSVYTEVKYDKKTVIIVGNENKGVSQLVQKNSDFNIYIPMVGTVQSLNVSVATGIILSEVKRQQK